LLRLSCMTCAQKNLMPVRSTAGYHRHFWSDVHRCMLVPLAISLAKTDCQAFWI
jgi:hypothetical protein